METTERRTRRVRRSMGSHERARGNQIHDI